MRAIAIALLAIGLGLSAAGCDGESTTGSEEGPTAATPADLPPGVALVSYTRGGGVAFTARHMVVYPDGSARVKVEGPGKIRTRFQLTDTELAELRGLLDDATLESTEPSGCNDCYLYSVAHAGPPAIFDETEFPPGTEPLVDFLSALIERETPSGPARDGG